MMQRVLRRGQKLETEAPERRAMQNFATEAVDWPETAARLRLWQAQVGDTAPLPGV